MARNTAAMKRGWNYDPINSRLCVMVDGLECLRLAPPSTSGETLVAQFGVTTSCPTQVKIHNRNASTASALEIRHRWVTRTPAHNAIDAINYCRSATSMSSGYAYGASMQQWVDSGYTVAGGYLAGSYSQLTVQGTMNGSGIVACAMEGFISNGGTWTSVNILANLWLDTHLDRTPTSASGVHFIYCSNNGSASKCTYDSVIRVNAEKAVKYLWSIYNGEWDTPANGMVGAVVSKTNKAVSTDNYRTIKIDLDGTAYYLLASAAWTVAS